MASVKWLFNSTRLYRLLLYAYPASFRQEYGECMVQVFRALCWDAFRQRGLLGLVRVWFHVFPDLVATAIDQHLQLRKNLREKLNLTGGARRRFISAIKSLGRTSEGG